MKLPSESTMYDALVKRDASFDGLFFVGVKTTGIFCRPSCPAKKPHEKNVEFFPTVRDAMYAGYRACKRCRPLDIAGASPDWATRLMERVEAKPDGRMADSDLRDMDIDPATARRFFQSQFGMTFQGFQRARRLGRALAMIRAGESTTAAAIDNGFESSSGFRDAFARLFGCPPSQADDVNCLTARWIDTPIGAMLAIADDAQLVLLEFVDRRALETEINWLRRRFRATIVPGANAVLEQIEHELKAYFGLQAHESEVDQNRTAPVRKRHDDRETSQENGTRRKTEGLEERRDSANGVLTAAPAFEVPFPLVGTDFQTSVWRELLEIPLGETRSYSDIARAVGKPNAVRAVGTANGANRLAIVIPCHRVVRSDGSLCGYGGGRWRKEWLLDHEAQVCS